MINNMYVVDDDHGFFLSRFKYYKDGQYRPVVAELGRIWLIDFREDRTTGKGWCFACVATHKHPTPEEGSPFIADYRFVLLGRDPYKTLPDSTISLIKQALKTDFVSKALAEILMELLLLRDKPGGCLTPTADGKYQIFLKDLLMEFSTEEAYAFLAERSPDPPQRTPLKFGVNLSDALAHLERIVDTGRNGWLEIQLAKTRLDHPLVENYRRAAESVRKQPADWDNESVIWVKSLVNDWMIVSDLIPLPEIAARLREPVDCESLKYELFVMGAYRQAGATVQRTDSNRSGEFKVSWGEGWVYVECKRKEGTTLKDRAMGKIYKDATQSLFDLMEELGVKALVCIRSRSDVNEKDLSQIKESVSSALKAGNFGRVTGHGKIRIEILPPSSSQVQLTEIQGLPVVKGFEHQSIECLPVPNEAGVPSFKIIRAVTWESSEPSDWLNRSTRTFREAGRQLKRDYPGIVYIQVPEGPLKVVLLRVTNLTELIETRELTREDGRRVNAVVVTGAGFRQSTSGEGTIWSTCYKCVFRQNPPPWNALPLGFKIFGHEFGRSQP